MGSALKKPIVKSRKARGENDADQIWERIWVSEDDKLSPYD